MIGVMKNPSCIRFAMMSRRSRNNTAADDTAMTMPATKMVCSSIRNGTSAAVAGIVAWPKYA